MKPGDVILVEYPDGSVWPHEVGEEVQLTDEEWASLDDFLSQTDGTPHVQGEEA